MGVNVDADIMYGMVLYAEEETLVKVPWRNEEDYDEDEEDFENWVCRQLGLEPLDYSTYPDLRYDPLKESYESFRAREREASEIWGKLVRREEYWAKKKELLATVPVEEEWGGTEQARSRLLCLKAAPKIRAYYFPVVFDPIALTVPLHLSNAAFIFLAQFNVVWEPKWLLVPSYG